MSDTPVPQSAVPQEEQGADLQKRYDPKDLESSLYSAWTDNGLFGADPDDPGDPYVIVIPPPNVTAVLHMGHGLNNTLQDVVMRRRRMQGRKALWVPGTDHAGIATQNVVERELRKGGKTRFDLGREAFEARVWEWVGEYGGRIIDQLKKIGCSCDWDRTRFTLDEGLSRAVREVFVRLYEKNLVYRGRYIINWCPRCCTALSNEEAEHHDVQGKLYRIRYRLVSGGSVEVATTRPETMLGDTGLAVHPDDSRFRGVVGQDAILPLVGRRLPVVADDYVDPEFGSGVVKVTPAHDPNDFEIGQRHNLDAIDVMTKTGAMSEHAPECYRGLDRFQARRRIVEDLKASRNLVSVEDHAHSVGRCYRCDTVVEPRLSKQWFVRMKPLAEPALKAYKKGELRFHPERYGRVYQAWMENIRDWCISRQLWWGHRIPVWYCDAPECGRVTVVRETPEACPSCNGTVRQDEDVLDTWFSSWLWPFSTLGWPEETDDLQAFYPTHTLVTAPEILFFWVARMVMAGCEFRGEIPFTDVVLNGTVRDHRGRRMSKSLGNGIDPLEVVEAYGADAMRFTLVRGSPPGTDIQLDYGDLEAAFRPGRNFANKIWNAARFALPHIQAAEGGAGAAGDTPDPAALADRWIMSRLARVSREVDSAYESFRTHEVAEMVHAFVWGEFCDWYLELVKGRLTGGGPGPHAAGYTLGRAMEAWLTLLHPVMPFVTEAIAGQLPWREGSLVRGPWVVCSKSDVDPAAEDAIAALQDLVHTTRNLRAEYNLQPNVRIQVFLADPSDPLREVLTEESGSVERLAAATLFEGRPAAKSGPGAHAVLKTGGEVVVPLGDVLDLAEERRRLGAELDRVRGHMISTARKLANPGFLNNAPTEVVDRERRKLRSLEDQDRRLENKLSALR